MIGQRYLLGDLYKKGSQARIWKAQDRLTGESRIIKTGEGVKREAVLTRTLVHPLIGYAYDCGVDPHYGDYSVYPEFCGKNALDWVTQTGDARIKQFAAKASEFLCFVHQQGWLYNDFKPEHFLMTENGLKVIDFGLCTPLQNARSSGTFSGTFPYISPERLNGRPYDQRSDIFALGVLLLQMLLPDEPFPSDPSNNALNTVLYNVRKLKEPWRKLISQMTALEPSQRISTANELWKKLQTGKEKSPPVQSSSAKNIFLPPELFREKMLFIQCPTEDVMKTVHSEALIHAWKNNEAVFSFHCKDILPEKSFEKLCVAIANQIPESACSLLEIFQKSPPKTTTIIYLAPEVLAPEQKAMLNFGISCFSEFNWIKVCVLTAGSSAWSLPGAWKRHQIPLRGESSWNATSLEAMDPARRKILNAIAVAGGSLPLSALDSSQDSSAIPALAQQGLIHFANGSISILMTPESLLSRMRKSQRRSIAVRILERSGESLSSITLFYLAVHAEKRELAARSAMMNAGSMPEQGIDIQRMEWLWNAFHYGADVGKKTIYQMAKFYLHRGNGKRVRQLLVDASKKFGKSFRLASLYIDYYLRRHQIERALKFAESAIHFATVHHHTFALQYFTARRAGLLVHRQDFIEAEKLLNTLDNATVPAIIGLRHHYRGLIYFHQGKLNQAVEEYTRALKFPHHLRSGDPMNIGIALGKMRRFDDAHEWLIRALNRFSKTQDQEMLSRVFLNMGMNYITSGNVTLARKNFLRSLHLSRSCGCYRVYVISLSNLAFSYELRGRNERAVSILNNVYRLAKRFHVPVYQAIALSNLGIHYAYRGQFRKAVGLLAEAIRIRVKLKLRLEQARTEEYLGIAYLLSSRYKAAKQAFLRAKDLYSRASQVDRTRNELFLCMVSLSQGDTDRAIRTMNALPILPENSFELGLSLHLRSMLALSRKEPSTLEYAQDAERIFRKVPSLFWLAKNFKVKAEIYRSTDRYEKSLLCLQAAYHLFTRMGCNHELRNLPKEGKSMKMYQEFLEKLAERLPYKALQMLREILSVEEVDSMVERILQAALELTSMDRALLLLVEDPPRVFRSASLKEEQLEDIIEVSRSVLTKAIDSGEPVICLDASSDPSLQDRPSILNNQILSVICIPLRGVNLRPIGCLYLDSREGVETIEGTEKVMLEIFSSIIGLALSQSLLLEKSVRENRKLKDWLEFGKDSPEMIGSSPALMNVLKTVQKVANHNLPILITGETGTGKELVARMIHYSSSRKNGPFVAVNCAAFSRDLLESELFGHEKGAFTGAIQQKRGLFEAAKDGTLMLDEIGEMPLEMQSKLLRVLQDGEYRRIGSTQTQKTNARIVLATNRNIDEMVGQGKFREDLLYRIKVLEIHLPPLRERTEDIPLLASAFLKQAMIACDKKIVGFTSQALRALKSYSWPGNVRQIKSEIERVVALAENEWIDESDLDERIAKASATGESKIEMNGSLAETEKRLIQLRLEEHNWNVASAARSLGITRHGLYSKMRRYRVVAPR